MKIKQMKGKKKIKLLEKRIEKLEELAGLRHNVKIDTVNLATLLFDQPVKC